MHDRRVSIGLLVNNLYEDYVRNIWRSIVDEAEKADINLLCFTVGTFEKDPVSLTQQNAIHRLPSAENLDGLISVTASICNYLDSEKKRQFLDLYRGLPVVNIGEKVPGYSSVLARNSTGMRALMEHMIAEHGYRRIAFIKGTEDNPEAQERLREYREALYRHGIPCDSSLIVPGDFSRNSGTAAVVTLLDERQASFEALVAANDLMAIDAMKELQCRGISVPEDIAVAGFDDSSEGRAVFPALTTVKQSCRQLGTEAFRLLMEQIRGMRPPSLSLIPTRLVVRQSCGCTESRTVSSSSSGTQSGNEASPLVPSAGDSPESILLYCLEQQFSQQLERERYSEWARRICGALLSGVEQEPSLGPFDAVLREAAGCDIEPAAWYPVLSSFFANGLESIRSRYPEVDLFVLQRDVLTHIATVSEYERRSGSMLSEQQLLITHRIGNEVNSCFNIRNLEAIPVHGIRELGIGDLYLSLYDLESDGWGYSTLYLCCKLNTGEAVPSSGASFPSRMLLPGGLAALEQRVSFAVQPLRFQEKCLGFLLIEIRSRNGLIYEILADHLSSALNGERLLEQVQRHASHLEEEVRRRTSDLRNANEMLRKKNSEIQALMDEIQRKSKIDYLTRVYNRGAILELLNMEKKRTLRTIWRMGRAPGFPESSKNRQVQKMFNGSPSGQLSDHFGVFSLMMVDVDHFKNINDSYGHLAGDHVLEVLGNLLLSKQVFRENDLAGRFGGEEFVVILPETSAEHARYPARRLQKAVAESRITLENGEQLRFSVSIGISEFSIQDQDNDQVIHRADRAMYYAKEKGRNKIVLYEEAFGLSPQ